MSYQQAKDLLDKYKSGNITDAEKALVEKWLFQYQEDNAELTENEFTEISKEIWNKLPQKPVGVIKLWPRIAAVASVLLLLTAGTFYFVHKGKSVFQRTETIAYVAPGGNKAILTLANGQKIVLTTAKDGQLAVQDGTAITKTADGSISYQSTAGTSDVSSPAASSAYNMVSTPVGGQYHLTLADGTNVWLNAASSIKYPTAFNSDRRKVEITGEVYFEVTHNPAKPFLVQSKNQEVEVLGTHFNINCYGDDNNATKTTLLEGSVKVTGAKGFKLIKPGQQTVLRGNNLAVAAADMEEVVAWKNGYFKFNGNLEGIMSKVARWYDVSIVYQSKPDPGYTFEGEISRARPLGEILKIMEYTGKVHFTIEGRRIIVSK